VILDYFPSMITLLVIQLLGVMSPGPDFAVVMRNSLVYTRRAAIFTVLGVTCGDLLHMTYIVLGLGVIIAKTAWLLTFLKYIGAGYLIYIGILGIRTKKHSANYAEKAHQHKVLSDFKAFRSGFFTNITNFKAMLFFIGLFSGFITPEVPNMVIAIYVAIILVSTFAWFLIVAIFFSNKHLISFFKNFQHIIERVTGGFLILLGIKILFTKGNS